MPYFHPKTWDDGVMPLDEFDPDRLADIMTAVMNPHPPPKYLFLPGAHIVSRAWREWHWARGRQLEYIPGPGRRKLSPATRRAVIERDGYTCGICGGAVEPTDVHIDHVYPHSLGGSDDLDNLQVAHSRCNIRKGARI